MSDVERAPFPDPYLIERVHEALLTDHRVGEMGLTVHAARDCVVVRGVVSTEPRHTHVAAVVAEILAALGDHRPVVDETHCIAAIESAEVPARAAEEVR